MGKSWIDFGPLKSADTSSSFSLMCWLKKCLLGVLMEKWRITKFMTASFSIVSMRMFHFPNCFRFKNYWECFIFKCVQYSNLMIFDCVSLSNSFQKPIFHFSPFQPVKDVSLSTFFHQETKKFLRFHIPTCSKVSSQFCFIFNIVPASYLLFTSTH